jgi:hypothetical protein
MRLIFGSVALMSRSMFAIAMTISSVLPRTATRFRLSAERRRGRGTLKVALSHHSPAAAKSEVANRQRGFTRYAFAEQQPPRPGGGLRWLSFVPTNNSTPWPVSTVEWIPSASIAKA